MSEAQLLPWLDDHYMFCWLFPDGMRADGDESTDPDKLIDMAVTLQHGDVRREVMRLDDERFGPSVECMVARMRDRGLDVKVDDLAIGTLRMRHVPFDGEPRWTKQHMRFVRLNQDDMMKRYSTVKLSPGLASFLEGMR